MNIEHIHGKINRISRCIKKRLKKPRMSRKYFYLMFILLVLAFFPFDRKESSLTQTNSIAKQVWLTPEEIRDAEKDFKRERRKKGYQKADGPDQYMQFHYGIRTRESEERPQYGLNYRMEELTKAKESLQLQNKRVTALDWKERGPANVPGRTRAIVVDPLDSSHMTWFAGSVGGGIWKTINGGDSWQILTPDLPNMAISTLAQSISHPKVIYAGSGEGFFNFDAITGDGMLKSTDGGLSWNQLPSTTNNINFQNINRIIVDPDDPNILLICSNHGVLASFNSAIMRSVDGGLTWTKVYTGMNRIQHLIHVPSDFMIQYASVNSRGVIKSVDGGLNWADCNSGLKTNGRIELAVSPVDPQRIYAAAEGTLSGATIDLYVSDDGAKSWQPVIEVNNGVNVNWTGSQGWYNNSIAAHPFDKNTVYVGGIDLWKMQLLGIWEDKPVAAEAIKTSPFLEFINFGGLFLNGGLTTGSDWFKDDEGYPTDLQGNDFVPVEIRFGVGKSQKAHRFLVPEGKGSGVAPNEYSYADYIRVPFEVWDLQNNRQLMVSFRDQDRNGLFNLETYDQDNPLNSREYIFVHAERYDSLSCSPGIDETAGISFKTIYCLWPALKSGAIWNPDTLPYSKIAITTALMHLKVTTNLTDMYKGNGGKNAHVHVDHHVILPVVTDVPNKQFKILNGNDGGVYVSNIATDPGTQEGSWKMAGNLYNTSQFYGVDKKRGADEYIGGAQDNGTWRSASNASASATSNYIYQIGGDGFATVWNYADPQKIIGSSQYNNFWRSLDGGNKWKRATTGLTDYGSDKAPFFSRLENVKSNSDVLYTVGANGVWRSDDFGENWTLTPISDSWTFGSFTNVKISLSDNKIIWAGSAISSTGKLHVSTNSGQSFIKTNGYSSAMGRISGMATHPTEDSTAYALFSFSRSPKILRTTNLGESWHDITGFANSTSSTNGFPNVAVYSLFVFPNETKRIWVGTEIGLVESIDNGLSWSLANNGLPNTAIWEIKLVDNQIVLATHGRGIWTIDIDIKGDIFLAPYIKKAGLSPKGDLAVEVNMRSTYDSLVVIVNDVALFEDYDIIESTKIYKIKAPDPLDQMIDIAVDAYIKGESIRSNFVKTYNYQLLEYGSEYTNDFNDMPQNDFIGTGFKIKMANDFSDRAVHSPHDYENDQIYIYYLKKPIVIAGTIATFSYDDIALVEPGEIRAAFGTEKFYDFVSVEGTKDGLNWLPLKDGYDANHNQNWLTAYQHKQAGRQNLFINHVIDLLETFSPSDTVLFRLRLFSDPGEVGWGWAFDNLSIHSDNALEVKSSVGNELSLKCYPIPVVGEATIEYYFPHPAIAKIEILNVSGQVVDRFAIEEGHGNEGKFFWSPPGKGIYIVQMLSSLGKKSEKILVK